MVAHMHFSVNTTIDIRVTLVCVMRWRTRCDLRVRTCLLNLPIPRPSLQTSLSRAAVQRVGEQLFCAFRRPVHASYWFEDLDAEARTVYSYKFNMDEGKHVMVATGPLLRNSEHLLPMGSFVVPRLSLCEVPLGRSTMWQCSTYGRVDEMSPAPLPLPPNPSPTPIPLPSPQTPFPTLQPPSPRQCPN